MHFLIRAKHREGFKNFLRALAGRIAQLVTNAAKGRKSKSSFWALPPFTRIVEWGKAYQVAKAYVIQNRLESEDIIPYQPRKRPSKRQRAAEHPQLKGEAIATVPARTDGRVFLARSPQ